MIKLYRLMAFDMDDTLLSPAGVITERTMAALRRAMDAGVYVVLASGRMLEAMLPTAEHIGVNGPMVLYNGGMVYDTVHSRTVSRTEIPLDTARRILRMAEENGVYAQAYPGEGYFAHEYTRYTDMYEKHIKVKCNITGVPLSEWITTGQVKMLFIGEKEQSPERIAMFSEAFPDVAFMNSKPHYIEVVAKTTDKAVALDAAARDLGLAPDECIAFGDGQNDVSMLNYVGAGYCMANASEGVKAKCRLFAPSNAEDGCAQVIERLLAEGKLGKV